MKCPECGAWSLIKSTRESETLGYIRRRECANYHRFTTQETVVPEATIKEQQRQAALKNLSKGRAKRMAFYSDGRQGIGAPTPSVG